MNLRPGGPFDGDFCAAEFPAHAVDRCQWEADHIAAGDLKRHLRFDGERLHGFDIADAGAERPSCAKPSARTRNEVTESLRLNETVATARGGIGLDAGIPVNRFGEIGCASPRSSLGEECERIRGSVFAAGRANLSPSNCRSAWSHLTRQAAPSAGGGTRSYAVQNIFGVIDDDIAKCRCTLLAEPYEATPPSGPASAPPLSAGPT